MTKRILLSAATLLLCVLAHGQKFNAAKLDSLKSAIKGEGELEGRVSALSNVLNYYAQLPAVDSVVAYSEFGLKRLVQSGDSLAKFRIGIRYSFSMGTAMSILANYAQAELYYQETGRYIAKARPLAGDNKNILKNLASNEASLRLNIAKVYLSSNRYAKADSCYKDLVAGFRAQKDTSALIQALLNQSGLYQRMGLDMSADSATAIQRLDELAETVHEEAFVLARSFLHNHPNNNTVLRQMLYLLTNKSTKVVTNQSASPQEKKELLALLMEALRAARENGYPGKDLLVPQTRMVMLLRVLGRYEKAIESATEVINTAHELKLMDNEALGYEERSRVYWEMKKYDEAITDINLGRELYLQINDFANAIILCNEMVNNFNALSFAKRYHYRKERARFEAKAKEYRQKAKEAGEEVPEVQGLKQ